MAQIYKSPEGYAAIQEWYDSALKRLTIPYSVQQVPTRFGQTHMLVMGEPDAPPLVLVQGYGASAPLWYKQFGDFAAHYRVYALDTPGHPGRSDPTPPTFHDDGYARWLLDVLDALNLERPNIGGVCLGGWIVLRMGIVAPERVRRALLLSPVGLAPFKIYWRSGVPLILNMGGDMEAAGQRLLVNAFTPPGSNLSFDRLLAKALMLAIKHYRIGAAVGFSGERPTARELLASLRILNRFVRGESARELRRFTAPALLMVGEYEAIYNPNIALRRALAAMPHLRAEIVPASGHAAIYDRPKYVNPRALAFLRE